MVLSWRLARLFRRELPRSFYPCDDCGLLTAPDDGPDEWYTVRDDVWSAAGASPDDILCVGCLEQRLGRELCSRDFIPSILNDPGYGRHSERLVDRLTRGC